MLNFIVESFQLYVKILFSFPIGTIFVLVLSFVVVVFTTLVIHSVWYLIDSSFRPCFRGSGTIVKKQYDPAYTTMIPMPGESTIFIPQQTPESYQLLILIKAGYGWISVNSNFYNSVVEGNLVYVIPVLCNNALNNGDAKSSDALS